MPPLLWKDWKPAMLGRLTMKSLMARASGSWNG